MGAMLMGIASSGETMGSEFCNTELSEKTAKAFLKANSTKDVNEVLKSHSDFLDSENWRPYGGVEKNWDRVNVQTSEPFGALTELIINSIDAILMRKAVESNVSPRSPGAPKNMTEAVNQFFRGVIEGNLSSLSSAQRTEIAEKSVIIGVKRPTRKSRFPNFTIVDHGEGQNHSNFQKTFLSLGEKNKEGIPFVQGRFNMGGTGSIVFCTRSEIMDGMYKFILSKRALPDSDGFWGWTLIRVRRAVKGEVLPVTEYFCPDDTIPHFKADFMRPFSENNDIGKICDGGSIVKLYEYDIGDRRVFFGLYDGLTTNLIECALPLRLYDFDAKPQQNMGLLRAQGINPATFSGMKVIINESKKEKGDDSLIGSLRGSILCSGNPDLGDIEIVYYCLDQMNKYLREQPYRFFYTINGQTQAKERASFLRRSSLDDLRNHLIVQINCNQMDATARSSVFKPDRERMSGGRLSQELRKLIADGLKEDGRLRDFARKIKAARIEEKMSKEEISILAEMAKKSPELKKLFGMGDTVSEPIQTPGGEEDYIGKKFPTYLKPIGLDQYGSKKIPINSYRRLECETDVENEYLSRDADPGTLLKPAPSKLLNDSHLRNGRLRIKMAPPKGAKVGDEIRVQFGFEDNNPDLVSPILFDLKVIITEAEKQQAGQGGKKSKVKNQNNLTKEPPDILPVEKNAWHRHSFDNESGGYVASQNNEFTVYVNMANRYLERLIMSEANEQRRELIKNRFRLGVGILTLAMYKRMVHERDQDYSLSTEMDDEVVRLASSAVAPHVVTLIQQLGEGS